MVQWLLLSHIGFAHPIYDVYKKYECANSRNQYMASVLLIQDQFYYSLRDAIYIVINSKKLYNAKVITL